MKKTATVPKAAAPASSRPAPGNSAAILIRIGNLLECEQLVSEEREDHGKLAVDLEEEEKDLLATADLNKPKQLKKVTDVRVRRELVPRKIESLEAGNKQILAELRQELHRLKSALLQEINLKKTATILEIRNALEPFFSGRLADCHQAAVETLYATDFGRALRYPENYCYGLEFQEGRELIYIKRLTKVAEQIAALTPYCGNIGDNLPAVRTVAQIEREELNELLQNPEGHIRIKMNYGLDRATAEETVKSRIGLLQLRYPDHAK